MRNSSQAGVEVIYEIKFEDKRREKQEDTMVKEIRDLEGVSVVNVVYYRGEIPG
jgi:uncharacterized tellurite resistance protein B-like protein